MATNWIVPKATDVEKVMSQIVANAAERLKAQPAGQTNSRATELLRMTVETIRAAVRNGGQVPCAATPGSVPPEAEQHALVLVTSALTASTPNLGQVVVGMNGGIYAPFDALAKAARAWVTDTAKGDNKPTSPTDPEQRGGGCELAPAGAFYDAAGHATISGLLVGRQYAYAPGNNEASLACGPTTLSAGATFVAQATTATLTGVAASVPVTASVRRSVDATNTTAGGDVVGRVDMSTDGGESTLGL